MNFNPPAGEAGFIKKEPRRNEPLGFILRGFCLLERRGLVAGESRLVDFFCPAQATLPRTHGVLANDRTDLVLRLSLRFGHCRLTLLLGNLGDGWRILWRRRACRQVLASSDSPRVIVRWVVDLLTEEVENHD